MRIAVIGAGVSGLSVAKMLSSKGEVTVFETVNRPGGLIKCEIVDGNLFHCTGGHVFNSKRQDVLSWFWRQFNLDTEFVKAYRNAAIIMSDGQTIPYPIENYVYYLSSSTQKSFIKDLTDIYQVRNSKLDSFESFLVNRFGKTLYEIYFKPYNYKIWRKDLKQIPLSWLEGKLPMPSIEEMIYNNINHLKDESLVHSSFYYPIKGGSQFIANRLAEGLNIVYGSKINYFKKCFDKWIINDMYFDKIIFSGNIKQLPSMLNGQTKICSYVSEIDKLESHGTTTVLCEIDDNPFSWIYLPSMEYDAHRIICTGNFSDYNNAIGKKTGTVEFTDEISKEDILDNLLKMPYNPKYITHNYEKHTYPIQTNETRDMIFSLKSEIEKEGIYLLGRFAEWEYYNMDAAIGAAMDLSNSII